MDDSFDWSSFQQPRKASEDRTIPRFHTRAVEIPFKSQQAGHPVYEDREFVEIIVPGNARSMPVEPVNEEHKKRWPDAYKAFKEGQEPPVEGTPIEKWPPISAATALNLRSANVRTVEQLAALPDGALQQVGIGGFELRKQAQVFVEAARNGTAPIARLVAEVEQLKASDALKDRQLAEQAATIDQLRAELAAAGSKKGKAHA